MESTAGPLVDAGRLLVDALAGEVVAALVRRGGEEHPRRPGLESEERLGLAVGQVLGEGVQVLLGRVVVLGQLERRERAPDVHVLAQRGAGQVDQLLVVVVRVGADEVQLVPDVAQGLEQVREVLGLAGPEQTLDARVLQLLGVERPADGAGGRVRVVVHLLPTEALGRLVALAGHDLGRVDVTGQDPVRLRGGRVLLLEVLVVADRQRVDGIGERLDAEVGATSLRAHDVTRDLGHHAPEAGGDAVLVEHRAAADDHEVLGTAEDHLRLVVGQRRVALGRRRSCDR